MSYEDLATWTSEVTTLLLQRMSVTLDTADDSPAARLLLSENEWAIAPGSLEPVKNLLNYNRAYVGAAIDYFEGAGIAALSSAAFDVDTLARSALEAAAFGYRLTDDELSDRQRMQRALVDQMWSLLHTRALVCDEGSSQWVGRTKRMQQLLNAGTQRGLVEGLTKKSPSIGRVAGARKPATDAIEMLIQKAWQGDPTNAAGQGKAMYRKLCAISHSNPVILINQSPKMSLLSGGSATTFAPSVHRYSVSILGALIGLVTAVNSHAEFHGHHFEDDNLEPIVRGLWRAAQDSHDPNG